ncbi:phosphonate ABC transporter, permease protein PhnE [Halobacteriales archaeon SW_8_68_21]|nr:MAG: phosphonate ABC transporter, permease protein PhnE [Halobacteriales archaeon SW_8_68_21]
MSHDDTVRDRYKAIVLARRVRALVFGVGLVVLAVLFYYALISVGFFEANIPTYLPNFLNALRDFFPFLAPTFPFIDPTGVVAYWTFITEQNLIWGGFGGDTPLLGEAGITLAMGFAGTVMGFPLALLFGVLGSGRVTPFPFNFIFRGLMSSIRAIPALVWGLIYIPIATDTVGNLGRLFTDELEEIEDGPIEAMETTGANKPQLITFGMLSQVTTPFIAWTLYIFEINVRIAVSLGIIGGGGLGQVLSVQQGLFRFTNMMATILVILVLIISVEIVSQRIRSALREGDEAQGLVALLLGFPQRMAEAALK